MKIVNVLALFILFAFFIISCQKELDFGNFQSTGTLKTDSLFDCLPSSVHGTYTEGSVLTDTNYIEVQVNVALSGNYFIQSDTVNGYFFKGTGSFNSTGLNTVRLYAQGTPLLAGPNSFVINYDSSFCIIEVDVTSTVGGAEFTYGGSGGTCTGGGVAGTYVAGLATTAGNTDTISVDVITLGSYSITTGPVNGITFSLSGSFTTLGPQKVILVASGTPIADGIFNFPVSGGSSTGCAFSVTVQPAAPPATYSLGNTAGACNGAVLIGNYETAIPTSSSNTVTVDVTVTVAGSYSISTALQNGIIFSGSGLFTTGTTQVTLTASGTPAAAGPFNFDIAGSSNNCSFSVIVTDPVMSFITCDIDGVFSVFNENAVGTLSTSGGSPIITIQGETIAGADPSLALAVWGTGASIVPGTYTTGQLAAGNYLSVNYYDATSTNFFADANAGNQTANPPVFTVVISTMTATRATGTFTGTIGDNSGAGPIFKTITNGAFDVPLQ